jgi:tRNA (5-methylaminomethyl-2-thiouridylate)-methyltransferase
MHSGKNMKIAVLVSGGVDSSVALQVLKNQGHELTAFYLKIWLEDELAFLGNCPWQEDLQYVEGVCQKLEVPLRVVSLQKEYWERVVSYTINQVKAGLTPNPDVLCNQQVKFGAFYDVIGDEFDKVATGHYAQVAEKDGRFSLIQAPDPIKDQTYFLSHLSQQQLSRALFPIGHLTKTEVRVLAHEYDLPTKQRKDSQGICFLGKLKFDEFLEAHLGKNPGDLIEIETDKRVGTHQGFWYYTIGQRQGIGLAGGPWYVAAKDADANVVYISRSYYASDKKRDSCEVAHFNWISGMRPTSTNLSVKLRHGAHKHEAQVIFDGKKAHIKLNNHDQGIAPGQFAAFYDGSICLGSGIIEKTS